MKRYRAFVEKKYWHEELHPRFYISTKFAFLPQRIMGDWIWFKRYFCLKEIEAFSFGGYTSINYFVALRALSIFEFKHLLKYEGVIKNLYRERIEHQKRLDCLPQNWRDMFNRIV